MKAIKLLILSCLFLMMCPSVGLAHQQKESYTTISFNLESEKLEITHRLLIHDAEHIVLRDDSFSESSSQIDLHQHKAAQEQFVDYIQQRFSVANQEQKILDLSLIGHEVDGKYFWVYQEADMPEGIVLYIKNSAFQEFWPTQINHVNVEKERKTYSARLGRQDQGKWKKMILDTINQ